MQKVIKMVSFELNSPELLKDWKKLSTEINTDLQKVDGFLERESAQDENGLVYCVVKWADESYHKNLCKNSPPVMTLRAIWQNLAELPIWKQ
jgi:hypothetical protein